MITYDCLCICDCCMNFSLFSLIRLKFFGWVHSLILCSPPQLKQLCLGLLKSRIYRHISHIKTEKINPYFQYSLVRDCNIIKVDKICLRNCNIMNNQFGRYLSGLEGSADLSTGRASKNTCSYLMKLRKFLTCEFM